MSRAPAWPIGCWCPLADSSKSVEKEGTFVFSGEGYLSAVIDIQQHRTASGCSHPSAANHRGLPEKFTAPSAVQPVCCTGAHWGRRVHTFHSRRWKTVAYINTQHWIISAAYIYGEFDWKKHNKQDLSVSLEDWVRPVQCFSNWLARVKTANFKKEYNHFVSQWLFACWPCCLLATVS